MTTLVTPAEISQLRRMVAEPSVDPYTDDILTAYIERYPHMDTFGENPTDEWGLANSNWTPSFDLAAAAADVWEEKAGTVAGKFDFTADGGNYSQSQQYEQYMKQCRYYRSRRLPSTVRLVKSPGQLRIMLTIGSARGVTLTLPILDFYWERRTETTN